MGAAFKGISGKEQVDKITEWLGGDARDDEEFTGLFKFEFDEDGRILTHVIERADDCRNWENGPKGFVGLTDWLLGRLGRRDIGQPGLALGYITDERHDRRRPTQHDRDDG